MKVHSLYLCPWSLNDPLSQSQSLSYIRGLAGDGYTFALITLEIERFLPSAEKIAETKENLAKEGIFWYPIFWKGGKSVSGKLKSFLSVIQNGFRVYRRHRPTLIHSRSSLPLFLALALHKTGKSRFLYDADSILSEEYADVKHLERSSPGFKLMAWGENKARRSADRIIVLTELLKGDLREKHGVTQEISVIPCCVDTSKFKFSETHRKSRRAELHLKDELLFIYVGKQGTWYLVEEMVDFFLTARAKNGDAKLLIVTHEPPAAFKAILDAKNVPPDAYFIKRAEHSQVTEWLSAADVGLAFIKPVASKRGTSPVKTSEYMASGLPIVSGAGIGDLDAIIEGRRVGVIVPHFTADAYETAFEKTRELLQSEDLRKRCGEAAYEEFDLYHVGIEKYRRIYKSILPAAKLKK